MHCASLGHPIIGDDIYGIGGDGSLNGGFGNDVMEALSPNRASTELQTRLREVMNRRLRNDKELWDKEPGGIGNLCLHAKELRLWHPYTGAPIVFECAAPF